MIVVSGWPIRSPMLLTGRPWARAIMTLGSYFTATSTRPTAASLSGSSAFAGTCSATCSPACVKYPSATAAYRGTWSGLGNQSSMNVSCSGAAAPAEPPAGLIATAITASAATAMPTTRVIPLPPRRRRLYQCRVFAVSGRLAPVLGNEALASALTPPRQRRPLEGGDGAKQRQRHDAQIHDGREDAVDVELRVRVDHVEAEPARCADPLADHRADDARRHRDAHAREHKRQRRGDSDRQQNPPPAGAEDPQEVDEILVRRAQAVHRVHHDGEEHDQGGHGHFRGHAVPEPHDQQRGDREHRNRLARDDERVDGTLDGPGRHDGE